LGGSSHSFHSLVICIDFGLLYEVRISRFYRNPLMNQSNNFSTFPDFKIAGMTKTVVHTAALLSPAEVAHSFGGQSVKECELVHGHWLLHDQRSLCTSERAL
jgi:hypothetical protein